jgi:predicted GNAT family N-acyltransferase
MANSVRILDLASASRDDLIATLRLVRAIWPKEGQTPEMGADEFLAERAAGKFVPGQDRWYVIEEQGKVVSTARAFVRPITIAGKPLRVIALGAVCTDPACRNRGLGGQIVRAAFGPTTSADTPFSLFQTSHKNRAFYEHLGCAVVANRIINSLAADPQKNPFWDQIVMRYPASKPWPEGTIDLLGPGY